MATFNKARHELFFKIVFYGPGLCGKTTTLQHIHAATKPERRGEMVSLATDADRTLYFDYVPIEVLKVGNLKIKLQLFTVPGQVYYAATRKLVLNGADAVVFVADSQTARLDANVESLDDLNANLAEHGRKLSAMPHAFQWNKRDLRDVVPIDTLERRMNLFGAPCTPTVATTGEGVFESLEKVTRLVIESYRAELPRADPSKATAGTPLYLDADQVGLAGAIRDLADSRGVQAVPTAREPAAGDATAGAGHAAKAGPTLKAAESAPLGAASPRMAPAAAAPAPAAAPALRVAAEEPHGRATTPAPPTRVTFSLAELWPPTDRDAVRRAEALIAAKDAAGAVLACDDLILRVLAACSVLTGGSTESRDPALMVALLELDGRRYLQARAAARRVRNGREATMHEAYEGYTFAIEARIVLERIGSGRPPPAAAK